jgi:hypothetical protein
VSAHLEPAVAVGHTVALATIVGAINGTLPALATIFAIIFYLVQIWESRTVQGWVRGKAVAQAAETADALLKVNEAKRNVERAAEEVVAVTLAHEPLPPPE